MSVYSVVQMKSVSNNFKSLYLERTLLNVVFAPQAGCQFEENEGLWSELDEVVVSVRRWAERGDWSRCQWTCRRREQRGGDSVGDVWC